MSRTIARLVALKLAVAIQTSISHAENQNKTPLHSPTVADERILRIDRFIGYHDRGAGSAVDVAGAFLTTQSEPWPSGSAFASALR